MFVNLTPHTISIHRPDGSVETVPPSGTVARLAEISEPAGEVSGVPILRTRYGASEGVPSPFWSDDPEDEAGQARAARAYLVSAVMLPALAGRHDVFAPATGPGHNAVRDPQGRVVGVTALLAPPPFAD